MHTITIYRVMGKDKKDITHKYASCLRLEDAEDLHAHAVENKMLKLGWFATEFWVEKVEIPNTVTNYFSGDF